MNARKGVTILLLVFVGVSVAYMIVGESMQRRDTTREVANNAAARPETLFTGGADALAESRTVVVYYFHGNRRCNTCRTIEAFTEEAIQTRFAADLQSGRVEWRPVNVDEIENRHFIDDFSLSTKTVVLVDIRNGERGKWTKLDKVWELVGDRADFIEYVQGSLADFLEESHG